jgi:hypothetical protein
VTAPLLRVLSESGETHDDPTHDVFLDLLAALEQGNEGFLIVERTDDPSGHTYAQTARLDDGSYTVEYRDGSAERHFATQVVDLRGVHELLTGWASGRRDWHDGRQWRRLVF